LGRAGAPRHRLSINHDSLGKIHIEHTFLLPVTCSIEGSVIGIKQWDYLDKNIPVSYRFGYFVGTYTIHIPRR
jgi:hypothetical protein